MTLKAEHQTVRFFDGLEVDGYSKVVGYAGNWLSRLTTRGGKTLNVLQGLGFTAYQLEVTVGREDISGASKAKTISLDDFNLLILYAASNGKKAALALQRSLTQVALNDFFRDAFGEPPLTIEEKRRLFYETYAATISPERWREMDREEILKLALPGDEPHLKDGLWNIWRGFFGE